MAVYVTGDCHGDFRRLNTTCFPEQKTMTKNDVVIICGDFGGVWAHDPLAKGSGGWKEEQHNLDWLESCRMTTVFCDGNHENFDRLEQFPVEEWHGGLVHVIRPHVLHLMRGQVYTLEGEKIFVFGGAGSHDIGHGIIDPDQDPDWKQTAGRMQKQGIWDFRIKGWSWWPQESFRYMDPDQIRRQKEEAIRNLDRCGWQVRYVISHELPESALHILKKGEYAADEHSQFLEEIRQRLQYFRWFAGHYHMNRQVTERDAVLYEQIVRIL